MKFSRKIFILMFAAITAATLISLFYLKLEAFRSVRATLRAKALSIAATAALQIDGDRHEEAIRLGSENSDAYKSLAQQLARIRDSNRREDTWVKFVYTLVRDPVNSEVMRFGVDPEEDPQNHSVIAEVVHKTGEAIHFGERYADSTISSDQWGEWLSAYAPIRDHNGVAVAALAVDIPAARLDAISDELLQDLLLALAIGLLLAWLSAVYLSAKINRPLSHLQQTVQAIGRGDFSARAVVDRTDEFGEVAASLNQMSAALAERDQVKAAFSRYVSQQVMETILADGDSTMVQGVRRRITVMFCDIRGFTSLSEKLRPEEVVNLLNEYFDTMVEIVFRNHGTLDKFIGDGLMIIFGAPHDDSFQEEHAITAALEMRHAINEMSDRWRVQRGIQLRIGMGIHSGNAIVGTIGSSKRMEYTAIGDTVNVASRLESATKDHGVDILISEYTYHSVRGLFEFKPLGSLPVRGREETVATYTIEEKALGPSSYDAPAVI